MPAQPGTGQPGEDVTRRCPNQPYTIRGLRRGRALKKTGRERGNNFKFLGRIYPGRPASGASSVTGSAGCRRICPAENAHSPAGSPCCDGLGMKSADLVLQRRRFAFHSWKRRLGEGVGDSPVIPGGSWHAPVRWLVGSR